MPIVFENEGEIDPRLVMLIGVNVKPSDGAVGFFGTGLKYAVACIMRWGESISIQSGTAVYRFSVENQEIRGKHFGVLTMRSRYDAAQLGFTTELGRRWEPWMVYRELWCNAHDEPGVRVYVSDTEPSPRAGLTRVIVQGAKLEEAHADRWSFLLNPERAPLHVVDGLEIYDGAGEHIFYRGIAVQKQDKLGLYTYNITEHLWLTEDRTAGSWSTDPVIARGIAQLTDRKIIDATLAPPADRLESRLDYSYVSSPGDVWTERAKAATITSPLDVLPSIRGKFIAEKSAAICPTCGRVITGEGTDVLF